MSQMRVCVIGGGAAGLIAAIFAAREGAAVTLLEKNEKPAKKLLMTGNGRCNFTNEYQSLQCYHAKEPEFIREVFEQFSMQKTVEFFREIGIYPRSRNGYLYPLSNQAASVAEVLELEARFQKVKIKLNEQVIGIEKNKKENTWIVKTKTWKYEAEHVIITCGSPASLPEGEGWDGYTFARKLGHEIISVLPSLVPLNCKAGFLKQWAGVRVEGRISLMEDKECLVSEKGELQLTEYGVSGIPVFQISACAARKLEEGKKIRVRLDFMPDFSLEELKEFLKQRQRNCNYKNLKEILIGLFPAKLISVLVTKNITEEELVNRIKNLELPVKETKTIHQAQVCQGGVKTSEINEKTMESKYSSGIYFAGEVVDVDGICGGYNLQWAWSSGAIAGMYAGKEKK